MQVINKMINRFLGGSKKESVKNSRNTKKKVSKKDYFSTAKSWADDIYTETVVSRNRYKAAFYWAAGLATVLVLCIMLLVPAQHTELVVVHHYKDGTVWVEPTHQKKAPINQAQTESEIVRYVINRESYDPSSYATQYSLVMLLSSSKVSDEYTASQSASNKDAPINLLGNKGYRRVHVEDVIFVDNANQHHNKHTKVQHHNLAQVNYRITDYSNTTGKGSSISLTALVSWKYRGTPKAPENMWRDWDGFTVTRFTVSQRNVN